MQTIIAGTSFGRVGQASGFALEIPPLTERSSAPKSKVPPNAALPIGTDGDLAV